MKNKLILLLISIFLIVFSLCYAATQNTNTPYVSVTIFANDGIVANYIRNTNGKVQNNISSKKLMLDDGQIIDIDVGVKDGSFASVDISWNGNIVKTYAVERISVVKPITRYDVNTLTITVHTVDKDNNKSDFSRTISVYSTIKSNGSIMERIIQKQTTLKNINVDGEKYLGTIKDYKTEKTGSILINDKWYSLGKDSRIVLSDAIINQNVFYQIVNTNEVTILQFVDIYNSGDNY